MSEPFLGEIRSFGFNFPPRGWAFCDGQLLPIAQNTALFSLLGTTYGGDGRSTVGLPNLKGRAAMHPGRGPGLTSRRLGETGGVETVTLTEAQTPSHNHSLYVDNDASQESNNPTGRFISASENTADDIYLVEDRVEPNPPLMSSHIVQSTGGQAHLNLQPYLTMTYCIALEGLYPSRS